MATPSSSLARVPPQSLEAERALLGAIMLKPECMYDVSDLIRSEHFYAEKHRVVYTAMLELFKKSDPIDMLSVASRLKATKNIDRIGGASFLAEIVSSVPTT